MKPTDRFPADDPREWLRRAQSNLARALATRGLSDVCPEDVCFDAQQAAEKAIKAVLVARCVSFPKTHDLAALLSIVREVGIAVPGDIAGASSLTDYAVATRYPGNGEPVNTQECAAAIEQATLVLHWAQAIVEASGK
jgi:HEPN domain-containing protein